MADNPNLESINARPNIADLADSDPLSTGDLYNLQHPAIPQPPAPSAELQAYMNQLHPVPISAQQQGALLPGMKPGSLGDMWNTVQFRGMDVPQDIFQGGKRMAADFRNPKLQNQFYERYAEHPDFDELGFSPFRDNEALYNEHASWWNEMQRATGQWTTLAGLGFKDAWGFGSRTDTETAAKFQRAMAIGSSSKGGIGGFTTNLFLNSGYTMGIMGELAVEEAAMLLAEAGLALVAPVTGGTSLAGNVAVGARMLTKIRSVGKKLEDAYETGRAMYKTLDNLQDVSKARKFFNTALNSAGDFINPLENTTQYFRSVNSMKDLGKLVQTSQGFASFYKDIRNIRLAFGEASLEGGMVQNEMTDTLYEAFVAENGRQPNEAESIAIREKAIQAGQTTTLMNVPAIYFSDKLMFDGLVRGRFKRLYAGKVTLPKSGEEAFMSFKGGVPVLEDVAKGMWNRTKQFARNPKILLTKGGDYFKANITEGIQETLQDVISATNKQYYVDQFLGDSTRGGYLNYMASALNQQVSAQGAETFLSGFLMGGMVSPISTGITATMHGKQGLKDTWVAKVGGAINDQTLRMKWRNDPGKYAKYRENIKEEKAKATQKRLDDINLLNKYFEDPTKYFSPELHNLIAQKKYAEAMTVAAQEGNRFDYQDAKDSAGYEAIKAAVHMGHLGTSIQRMEEMKQMSDEDIKQTYGMTKQEFDTIINTSIQRAKGIERRFNEAAENKLLRNPFNPNKYKDPYKRNKEFYGWKAWNDAIDDLVFGQVSFDRALERRNQLLDEFKKVTKLNQVPFSDFVPLQNHLETAKAIAELDQEITLLTPEGKTPTEASAKKLLADKKSKRALLEKFQTAATEANVEIGSKGKISKKTHAKLRKAYGQYLNFLTEQNHDFVTDDAVDASLTQLIDSYMLDARAVAANHHVNTLLDPQAFRQQVERYQETLEALHKNKRYEITAALAAFDAKMDTNEAFKQLAEKGIFVDPKDFKKLMKTGVMPRRLYVIENVKADKEEILVTSEQYQQAVAIFKKYLKDRGLSVNEIAIFEAQSDPYASQIRTKDPNDNREYEDLAKQFGFDPEAERSSVPLAIVLEAVIKSSYSTPYDVALAEELLKKATDQQKVTFTRKSKEPAYYLDSEQSVVDPRYSAAEYSTKDSVSYPIEYLILKNEIQRQISEGLSTDTEFKNGITALMTEATEAWKALSETEQKQIVKDLKEPFKGFKSAFDFATEAMTNERFQEFLATVKSKTTVEGKSVWKKFVDAVLNRIKAALTIKKKPSGTVLNATLDLISTRITTEEVKAEAEANTPIPPVAPPTPKAPTAKLSSTKSDIPVTTTITSKTEKDVEARRAKAKADIHPITEEEESTLIAAFQLTPAFLANEGDMQFGGDTPQEVEKDIDGYYDELLFDLRRPVKEKARLAELEKVINDLGREPLEGSTEPVITYSQVIRLKKPSEINGKSVEAYILEEIARLDPKKLAQNTRRFGYAGLYKQERERLQSILIKVQDINRKYDNVTPQELTEEITEPEEETVSQYPLVSDTEMTEFEKTGQVTPARVVILTNKIKNGWVLTTREMEMMRNTDVQASVNELAYKLLQPYRAVVGDEEKRQLMQLGYTQDEIIDPKFAHIIIQEGLTKQERTTLLVKQKPVTVVRTPEDYQNEVHQRFLDVAKNPDAIGADIENVREWAAELPTEYLVNGNVTGELIDQWASEAYTQLALSLNFNRLQLKTVVKLKNGSKGTVTKVTKNKVTIVAERDGKEYNVTPANMTNDIKYIVTDALFEATLPSEKAEIETTPEDKEKIEESKKEVNESATADKVNADVEKAKKTTSKDAWGNVGNKICK